LYHLAGSVHIAYDNDMSRSKAGFTIVEVIAMILVVTVLVLITVLAWSSTRTWSHNKTRENEVQQWTSSFDLYKSKFAYYPGMPTGADGTYYYCLGTFTTTNSKCGEYTSGTATKVRAAIGPDANGVVAASIQTELAKVGNVPVNSASAIDGLYIGPYVFFTKSTNGGTGAITITADIIGIFQASSCPADTTSVASPVMAGPPATGVISCKTTRTLTYTP
jgi:type II secretory pathway pseudopilin PulG